jgi:hypothetical protein
VVIGDSLSAGFQNFSLISTHQPSSYAALVAKQAKTPMTLPLIAAPGIPNELELRNPGAFPPDIQEVPGLSTGRIDPAASPTNLAVPGAMLNDVLTARPDPNNPDPKALLNRLILGLPVGPPQSQIERAEAMRPTTCIVWAGANDALLTAIEGSADGITPLGTFQYQYATLLSRAAFACRTVVTANIPDVTGTAAFIPVAGLAQLLQQPLLPVAAKLGVSPLALLTYDGLLQAVGILTTPGAIGPLPDSAVLDPGEIVKLKLAVAAYNVIIKATANALGVTHVDVAALVRKLSQQGYTLPDGRRLSTQFLGGLYSLDGVHPTNTGHAIIANEFIRKMNDELKTRIPAVNVPAIAATDPLVPLP